MLLDRPADVACASRLLTETISNISESSLMPELLEDWIAPFRFRAIVP